jgi:hypothetical protein
MRHCHVNDLRCNNSSAPSSADNDLFRVVGQRIIDEPDFTRQHLEILDFTYDLRRKRLLNAAVKQSLLLGLVFHLCLPEAVQTLSARLRRGVLTPNLGPLPKDHTFFDVLAIPESRQTIFNTLHALVRPALDRWVQEVQHNQHRYNQVWCSLARASCDYQLAFDTAYLDPLTWRYRHPYVGDVWSGVTGEVDGTIAPFNAPTGKRTLHNRLVDFLFDSIGNIAEIAELIDMALTRVSSSNEDTPLVHRAREIAADPALMQTFAWQNRHVFEEAASASRAGGQKARARPELSLSLQDGELKVHWTGLSKGLNQRTLHPARCGGVRPYRYNEALAQGITCSTLSRFDMKPVAAAPSIQNAYSSVAILAFACVAFAPSTLWQSPPKRQALRPSSQNGDREGGSLTLPHLS